MLTQQELKKHLHYNEKTGIFTRLIFISNKIKIGDIAGGKNKNDGYIYIRVNGKKYSAHRLAWLYVNGSFPKNCIDHINIIKTDNRICNLRNATHSQNIINQKIKSTNKTGLKCVYKYKDKWVAKTKFNKKNINLGIFETKELAYNAYKKFAIQNYGEFVNC